MKGPRLTISILIAASLTSIFAMIGWNLYYSWSQYARSAEEQLLLVALSCIAATFFTRAYTFSQGEKQLYTWPFKANVRQNNLITAFMFLGIICTPVTMGTWWTEVLHFAFTIAGILFAYADIVNFYERKYQKILGWVGFGCAFVGVVVGFWMPWWTLGVGETMAALPVAMHIIVTNSQENDKKF